MFNSIRTKLTIWYVGVLTVVIVAFAVFAYFIMVRALDRDADNRSVEMARNFRVELSEELEEQKGDPANEEALDQAVNEMRFRDYQFLIIGKDGNLIASTEKIDFDTGSLEDGTAFLNATINGQDYRVYQSPLDRRQNANRLLVFHSLKDLDAVKDSVGETFLFGFPLAIILAGFGGYFMARKSLGPMVDISRQAEQISAQNLSERISIKNENDELGDMARVFNDLLARLDASFEQQRRFMADASHELRTPLAIIRGESEVTLSQDARQIAEYKESLNIVHDESKRLTRIVDDLFTLARADAGQSQAIFAPVYLDEIAGEAVRSMQVMTAEKKIDLTFMSATEMPFLGDESLLHRLFLNLLDNAVKYSPAHGKVRVECATIGSAYRITVADNGIGIPPTEQRNIFDRFYRVDKARGRSDDAKTSGAGLGLSIASWIAEIHGGSVRLASSTDGGSVFSAEFVHSDRSESRI